MTLGSVARTSDSYGIEARRDFVATSHGGVREMTSSFKLADVVDDLIDFIAPCPWEAHAGGPPPHRVRRGSGARVPLYTAQERERRDQSPWTIVQGVLAPLQFLAFAVSLVLIFHYFITGRGYAAATISILVKTTALYTIMITGSIWEKVVFGRYLFAPAFFWEDVVSMLVLALHSCYLYALISGSLTVQQQMYLALAAYASYAINATQFVLKLRAARLQGSAGRRIDMAVVGVLAE
jgi:3-vinyl bacteriochlorophyllide hydratase